MQEKAAIESMSPLHMGIPTRDAKHLFNDLYEKTTKAFQILDWLQEINCGKCVLIGGEPTIHPKLPSIIKYGEDRGIPMHLVSNGRRFANENFCDQVISSGLSINRLTFSMYACSQRVLKN